ncbi:MAG: LptE family protein [Candidatus Aminicenantes bacterium]|nr:LptE family protein [Candidatus Aminicenantes bacterium]
MRKFVLIILSLAIFSSCGYHLAGTGTTLPSYIKKIYIPPVKNNTSRAEVETYMTSALRDEMARRGKEVVDRKEDADAELVGGIEGFRVYPVGINTAGESRRFSVFVTGKFVLSKT